MKLYQLAVLSLCGFLLISACSDVSTFESSYSPVELEFSGDSALSIEKQFVEHFPNRSSGQPNNKKAAIWLLNKFNYLGLTSVMDEWSVINYSKPVPLNNIVATLPGSSPKEILLVAHHDQSPDTYQGADNDGSGIAILLHLAEVFSKETDRKYTLVFLSSDGEEYGMLGTRRYVQTHPDPKSIIAGISLDNLGKDLYDGLRMDARGQFRKYGDLWLQLLTQEVAREAGDLWVPQIDSPLEQVLFQAVPVSFMDEGPLVAAGIPSFGLAGNVPPESAELHWETYHSPYDTLGLQSPKSLYHAGRVTEAVIRQLLSMDTFPDETGPYIYFAESGQVLRSPLWFIFLLFVALFIAAGLLTGSRVVGGMSTWRYAAANYLSLWIPLVLSILMLYLFVESGLMDEYRIYPATAKDEPLFEPRWGAVTLWFIALVFFFWMGRKTEHRTITPMEKVPFAASKSVALLVIGLGMVYILLVNPFSLLFLLPVPTWFFIRGENTRHRFADILLFLTGGLVVYLLFYFFGFVVLRNGFAVLWYLMMMFSIKMISFPTALSITAIIAAGLSMIFYLPLNREKSG